MASRKKNNPLILLLLAVAISVSTVFYLRSSPPPPSPEEPSGATRWVLADPASLDNPNISRFISQIVFHPEDPRTLYATVPGQGVFKSTNGAKSWIPLNEGLKTLIIFQLVINPSFPETLYLGTAGGGVYRSRDGGNSWVEANQGLANTSIEGLLIHPSRPKVLYAATTGGGLFKSDDDAENWTPFNQGLPAWDSNDFQTFLLVRPSDPDALLFSNYKGLFERKDPALPDSPGDKWKEIDLNLDGRIITYFFFHPAEKSYYIITKSGEVFKSPDTLKWTFVSEDLKKFAAYALVWNPQKASELFLAGGRGGLIRSADGGTTWKPVFGVPLELEVRSFAVEPKNPGRWFLGTRADGLWISADGGETWLENKPFPILDWATLMEEVQPKRPETGTPSKAEPAGIPHPPKEFEKCNSCHGWSHSALNSNWHSMWFVTPTPREWTATIERMKVRANLTSEEGRTLAGYLNKYFGEPGLAPLQKSSP